MVRNTEPIQDVNIVRRTFEGLKDPEKNADPVTSKYMPSHKFAVVCTQCGKRVVQTFNTKIQAKEWIDENK